MESVFESMPQATLQLVYITRKGFDNDDYRDASDYAIFIVSIVQSIISMTNSILKDDNSRGMQGTKWKSYKKRLPPSINFLKHGVSRLSQVLSRISVLSLFWTVVGGFGFGILLGFELLFSLWIVVFDLIDNNSVSFSTLVLSLNSIVLMPPELMFAQAADDGDDLTRLFVPCIICCDSKQSNGAFEKCFLCALVCCWGYIFCWGTMIILSHCFSCKCTDLCNDKWRENSYLVSGMRLGSTFVELCVIVIFGIININTRKNYLFSINHGLIIFIICIISFLIDCNYALLFPKFSLPNNINARSKWGFAFSGEIPELEKIKVRLAKWQTSEADFWDEGTEDRSEKIPGNGPSCAAYALANKHYHVVQWLESRGAQRHKHLHSYTEARMQINKAFDGWID